MISLYINDRLAVLDKDTTISIEEINPLWEAEAGGAFSYEFDIPAEQNRGVVGNADQVHGDSVYKLLNGKKFRMEVDGIPFKQGVVRLDSEVEVAGGRIPISIASDNKELKEMVTDLRCRDINIEDDEILIGRALSGMKISRELWRQVNYKWVNYHETLENDIDIPIKEFYLPGEEANNSESYSDGAAYCNIRLCYQHMRKNSTSDSGSDTYEKTDSLDVMEYNDAGSAPCFYVRYFLEKLFGQLGVAVTGDAMENIEDFNRIAFVNTNPCFKADETAMWVQFASAEPAIDRMPQEDEDITSYDREVMAGKGMPIPSGETRKLAFNLSPFDFWGLGYRTPMVINYNSVGINMVRAYAPEFKLSNLRWKEPWSSTFASQYGGPGTPYITFWARISDVYATSDNLPDESVQNVLDALQNAFGLRMLFDGKNGTMKIVLLRNVLKDTEIRTVNPTIYSIEKTEEDSRGFILRYSASSDKTEKKTENKTKYYNNNEGSTLFDYDDYSLTAYRDFSKIKKSVSAYDKCCYLDKNTGNAYRIKVNSEAENVAELRPTVMEVAQFCPAREGDCSDEDYIETVDIGFTPIILNDTNRNTDEQCFAVFVEEEIRTKPDGSNDETATLTDNSYGQFDVMYPDSLLTTTRGTLETTLDYSFLSHRNFDRAANEESPLFTHDWGFTLGVMRGPGSDGQPTVVEENYDGEGNDRWVLTSGSYAFHHDLMDNYGNVFDYNGTGSGTGADWDDLLTLRVRAEKENPNYTPHLDPEDPEYVPRFFDITGTWAPKRGLMDKFYAEYAHWMLNRKTARMVCRMELADIVNIDMMKKYRIGGVTGYIKRMAYTVSNNSGLSNVELEMYYL